MVLPPRSVPQPSEIAKSPLFPGFLNFLRQATDFNLDFQKVKFLFVYLPAPADEILSHFQLPWPDFGFKLV
jgi:hypothetical protein